MPFRIALAWILLSAPAFADQFDSVRDFIRTRMAERQVPSITVAVARDGKILWEEGFGWADRENRIAANEHTVYSLASITKSFTATALMTLVEKKRIDLDRPVNQYLGNAKLRARVGDADDATVRRVANHSSGLPLHGQFFLADEPVRPPSMDETILRFGNLVTIPGEKWEYSNLGYGILDYVISRVSGQSYDDYMRASVFRKLDLSHTSVGIGPGLEKIAAVRYGSDGLPLPFYDFDHRGASAIFSSAHDLVRFGMFHLKAHLPDQTQILSDASIDQMQTPSATSNPAVGTGYGVGWFINDSFYGYRTVAHSGSMAGVDTFLRLVPSEKIAVVVLCNSIDCGSQEVVDKVLETLLPKWRVPPPPANSASRPAPFQPPPALIGRWSGAVSTYKDDIPLTMNVLSSGDVQVQLAYQLKTLLNNVTWDHETLSGIMLGNIGIEEGDSRPYLLIVNLKLRGNVLNGPVHAGLPPKHGIGNRVAQWVELKKN
jgi:CubicO group peptidase (beta-lactamase class C family)